MNKQYSNSHIYTIPNPIKSPIEINNIFTNYYREDILDKAFDFHSKGNIKEAIKYYKYFVSQGFSDSALFSNYAILLRNEGCIKDAEFYLREAIKLSPEFAEAHSNLGSVLRDSGNLDEAEIHAKLAINLKPCYPEAIINLASIFIDRGDSEQAEILLRKAISLDPNSSIAYSNLGCMLRDQGNLRDAEICMIKALKLDHNNVEAYANFGGILKDLGKKEEAIKSWQRAIQLDPKLDKFRFILAQQLYYDGEYQLAIKHLHDNRYGRAQSLYLSCLLCLDRESEFYKLSDKLIKNCVCNAEIGGIFSHSNLVYSRKFKSPFCDQSMKYIMFNKINEDLYSSHHCEELIAYVKDQKSESRSQGILHNGKQSSGNLFSLNYPFINTLKDIIENQIYLYKLRFKDSKQGFIDNWPRNYELRSWIISMKSGGFLELHNHEYGWITGSFYLQVPDYEKDDDSGNIAFSYMGPLYPKKSNSHHLDIRSVKTRDLCIFPSSLFHRTIPFESSEDRICFVFDLVEKS